MLLAMKRPVTISTTRDYEKQLEALYERRHALNHLIESLECYENNKRIRAMRKPLQQKSA